MNVEARFMEVELFRSGVWAPEMNRKQVDSNL